MIGKLIALVLPLGLDTFAVVSALGINSQDLAPGRRLRVSLLMAGFEALMPLLGLAVGAPLGRAIGSVADYVAAGILIAFGLYTLTSGQRDEEGVRRLLQGGGWSALVLGLSVSLDELAIGFTLGLLRLPVLVVVISIAGQAFLLSQLGLRLGGWVGERLREASERLAGVALVGLGIGLVVQALI